MTAPGEKPTALDSRQGRVIRLRGLDDDDRTPAGAVVIGEGYLAAEPAKLQLEASSSGRIGPQEGIAGRDELGIGDVLPGVACQEHGTVEGGFLPGSWDHPVASDGTTRRVTPDGLIAYRLLQVVGLGGSRWRSGRLT